MAGTFIECRIDTRDLMRAQSIFFEYAKTVPALALNRTVLFIVKAAQKQTTVTSLSRIDTELAVEVTPRLGTRGAMKGQPLSMTRSSNRLYKSNVGPSFKPPIPFTWLLIGARARQFSNYNQLTGGRYAISGGHPFLGKKRSQFAQIMQNYVTRMVKARHSGSGFFMQAWGSVIQKLLPHVPANYRRGFSSLLGRRTNPALGDVTPALVGTANPVCIIALNLGMEGRYPAQDAQRNAAMHRILGPALQRAIDEEYLSKMNEAAKRGWTDRKPALTALGFDVTV